MPHIVQQINYHKCLQSLFLFETEYDADAYAASLIKDFMLVQHMDYTSSIYHNEYINISDLIAKGRYSVARFEFEVLTMKLPASERYQIYCCPLYMVPATQQSTVVTPQVFTSVPLKGFTVSKVPAKNVEKPCKVCKRNVAEDEPLCWNCGVKDPYKDD